MSAQSGKTVPKLNFDCDGGWMQVPQWLSRSGLDATTRFVWLRLWDLYKLRGKVYIRINTLAKDLTFSPKMVKRALHILVTEQLIAVEARPGSPNAYHLAIDHPLYHPVLLPKKSVPGGTGVSTSREGGVSTSRGGGSVPAGRGSQYLEVPYKEDLSEEDLVEEELPEKEHVLGGSLRSPPVESLRSSTANLTVDSSSRFWGSSQSLGVPPAGPLLQMPASGPGCPVASVPVFNSTSDVVERLSGLQSVVEAAKAKNKAEQARKAEKAAKRAQATKNLQGGVIPTSMSKRFQALETRWRGEFRAAYPNDIIAHTWSAKERGQLKTLLGEYADDDVLNGIAYYIKYFDRHRTQYKFSSLLPSLGHFVSLRAVFIPTAKRALNAMDVHARYHKWLKDNEMSFQPTPKELQAEYDAVKADLKVLGVVT